MTAPSSSHTVAGEARSSEPATSSDALQVEYCTLGELHSRAAQRWQDVLGVVNYGGQTPLLSVPLPQIPIVAVAAEQIGAAPGLIEIWRLRDARGADTLQSGQCGRVRYRHGGGLLFAALAVAERAPPAAPGAVTAAAHAAPETPALQRITQLAYAELFDSLHRLGFAHPMRVWNYLPNIHAASGAAERYGQFNAGRQDAFLQAGRRLSGDVPAASVLGVRGTDLVTIYCLARREAPLPLENPRQCSAWDYPRQYSERSPTFARACIDRAGGGSLFISGTASILGHRSKHRGDPLAQTRETLQNIRALLAAANERVGARRFGEQALAYKVYVRHPEDQSSIERVLREELGADPVRMFLRADVCRPELLVEIEATSV